MSVRAAILALVFAVVPFAAQAASTSALAPADEYFGQLKMSVLGIRNELNTLERRAVSERGNAPALAGKLAMVDDALRDWQRHYPRDTWLPRFQAQRARVAGLIGVNAAMR